MTKCTTLEVELRRRLWWSLVLFDSRISELASYKTTSLDPSWDCKLPVNASDDDLPQAMEMPPLSRTNPTEAFFPFIRCKLGEFVRHSIFHLDLSKPKFKTLSRNVDDEQSHAREHMAISELEAMLENQYFKLCDQENPIQFFAIWTTRAHLAYLRLLHHYANYSTSRTHFTETQRDKATLYAQRVLECTTKTMISPLTKGYRWYNRIYFPFPAFIQIANDIRTRPHGKQVGYSWLVLSDSYDAWFTGPTTVDKSILAVLQVFDKVIIRAWDACVMASGQLESALVLPRIVSAIKNSPRQSIPAMQETDDILDQASLIERINSLPYLPIDSVHYSGLDGFRPLIQDSVTTELDVYTVVSERPFVEDPSNDLYWPSPEIERL